MRQLIWGVEQVCFELIEVNQLSREELQEAEQTGARKPRLKAASQTGSGQNHDTEFGVKYS